VTSSRPLRYRRLAILGAWAPYRDEEAYARAARRLGLECRVYDVLHWSQRIKGLAGPLIERAVERFEPDFILCTRDARRLGPARLDRLFRRRATAMWHVDVHPQEGVIDLARRCSTLYVTVASQRERYRAAGVSIVRFLPAAMEPDRDVPATRSRPAYRCDVSFVGSGPYPYRWPVLQAVAAVCRLQIRGPGWSRVVTSLPIAGGPVHGARFAEVVAGAAVSLGASALAEQEREFPSASDRMWRIMGCGGAFVGSYVPAIEQFAQDGEHCRWFRSPDECVEQVRALLADPEGCHAMAQRGRLHALAHHTYDHRMAMLLSGEEYPIR
jgi:spore maturation protein CgeB